MAHAARAFVALGSNLGDRASLILAGREALAELPGTHVVGASSLYQTAPVGPVAQGPYLNAVLALETDWPPRSLLHQMLAIEASQGRRRGGQAERFGPRTLDLDLLLYGNECIDENGLEVPHPRLHERAFVLEPLCEVDPELIHPRLGDRLEVYRARLNDPDAVAHWADSADWVVMPLGSKR